MHRWVSQRGQISTTRVELHIKRADWFMSSNRRQMEQLHERLADDVRKYKHVLFCTSRVTRQTQKHCSILSLCLHISVKLQHQLASCPECGYRPWLYLGFQPGDHFRHQSLLSAFLWVGYQEVDIMTCQLPSGKKRSEYLKPSTAGVIRCTVCGCSFTSWILPSE